MAWSAHFWYSLACLTPAHIRESLNDLDPRARFPVPISCFAFRHEKSLSRNLPSPASSEFLCYNRFSRCILQSLLMESSINLHSSMTRPVASGHSFPHRHKMRASSFSGKIESIVSPSSTTRPHPAGLLCPLILRHGLPKCQVNGLIRLPASLCITDLAIAAFGAA